MTGPTAARAHTAPRSPSICRNQATTRFQLAKVWLARVQR